MKRAFRALAWTLASISGALLLGTFVPRPLWPDATATGVQEHRILVLSNPIHTDIAIPIDDATRTRFGFVRGAGVPIDAPGARYLVVGWGGRDFYLNTPTWSQLKLVPFLKGITVDRSVMHVDVVGDIPSGAAYATAFDLDRNRFDALTAFVIGSFTASPTGPIAIDGFRYGDYDAFYEADGRFSAILGCNTWTAAALRAGGLRTGWWNPLPPMLGLSLALYN